MGCSRVLVYNRAQSGSTTAALKTLLTHCCRTAARSLVLALIGFAHNVSEVAIHTAEGGGSKVTTAAAAEFNSRRKRNKVKNC